MSKPDIIDEIINSLEPEAVPPEYIILAKVYTPMGEEIILTADELEDMLENDPDNIASIRIILDVRKIRRTLISVTDELFASLRRAKLK